MRKLRIVFIDYWSLDDNLTASTILPWLRLLQQDEHVEQVLFFTIEREKQHATVTLENLPKIRHYALFPLKSRFSLLTKVSDFIYFPKEITRLAKEFKATTLIAHGAPAGALAYKVWQKLQLPFYVSLFEPHADYMLESGVWNRTGLKYRFQKRWEKMQLEHATGLITVSENYKLYLQQQGIPETRIAVAPCSVEIQSFQFNTDVRKQVREQLGWGEAVIGIYAGKYGGLYYNEEAFYIYKRCFEFIPDFRLLILSPQPGEEVRTNLRKYNIDPDKVHVTSVSHEQVPAYLSASDFAFATYKPGSSQKYLSPVKVGEYWASGLPVLLTEGVGDDSNIIKREGGGALFDLQQKNSLENAIKQLLAILQDKNHRQKIAGLAAKYRSPERLQEAYRYFLRGEAAR